MIFRIAVFEKFSPRSISPIPTRYIKILVNLRSQQYAELLKVFRSSRRFNDELFQCAALQRLFDRCLREQDVDLAVEMSNLLWAKPPAVDFDPLVGDFFLRALDQPSVSFMASESLWSEISNAQELITGAEDALRASLESSQWSRASLACSILLRLQPDLLFARLQLLQEDQRPEVRSLLANQLIRLSRIDAIALTDSLLSDQHFRRALARCVGRYWDEFVWPLPEKIRLVRQFVGADKVLLLFSGWRVLGDQVQRIIEVCDFYFPYELFAAAERIGPAKGRAWLDDPPGRCYALTARGMQRIGSELEHLRRTRVSAISFGELPTPEKASSVSVLIKSREMTQLNNLVAECLRDELQGIATTRGPGNSAVNKAIARFLKLHPPTERRLWTHVEKMDLVIEIEDFSSTIKETVLTAITVDIADLSLVLDGCFGDNPGIEGVEKFFA